jgi:hypothetical protein
MNKQTFDLTTFKNKIGYVEHERRNIIIGKRANEIRQTIMRNEQFKMQNIEGYALDAYAIETMPIIRLLEKYGLKHQYNTNQYSDNFLTEKNNNAE